jgi:succinate dehydrogenase / fumarate reductase cytochrome b subunit
MVVLGLHLYHGAWSVFHTLGINHVRYNDTLRSAASAVALAVVAGFLAVPVGVYAGWVR